MEQFKLNSIVVLFLLTVFILSCGESSQSVSETAVPADTLTAEQPESDSAQLSGTYAIADTVISVPTDRILNLLDEMKAQMIAKEASLSQREAKLQHEYEQMTRFRHVAWIMLLAGVVLCLTGLGLIYRSRHSRVYQINKTNQSKNS